MSRSVPEMRTDWVRATGIPSTQGKVDPRVMSKLARVIFKHLRGPRLAACPAGGLDVYETVSCTQLYQRMHGLSCIIACSVEKVPRSRTSAASAGRYSRGAGPSASLDVGQAAGLLADAKRYSDTSQT